MKLFHKMAQFLYDRLNRCIPKMFENPQVKSDLEHLYPGQDREKIRRDFYIGKIEKSMMIISVGIALSVMLAVRAGIDRRPDRKNAFARDEMAYGVREVGVEAVIDGNKERFRIQMEAKQLSEKEIQELYQEFRQKLPQLILGENVSLQEVKSDLDLMESFDGFPFRIEWKSDNQEGVSSAGMVKRQDEIQSAVLTATVTYDDMQWEERIRVEVPGLEFTDREKNYRAVEKMLIDSESESRKEEYWILPEEWNGQTIVWNRIVEDYSPLVGGGAFLVGIMIYFLKDKDLHSELGKRRAHMKREYPDIVHKLALYLGAGMTLRGAFQKIADEYELRRSQGCAEGPAYEEMLIACREMKSGVSEGEVYEHFGKRTGLQEYIRLCTLLSQNLKKGNNALIQRLYEEADKACLERIQNSRKLGEEASTKLLIPMVMMLGVVMVMIMLPAFYSMGM